MAGDWDLRNSGGTCIQQVERKNKKVKKIFFFLSDFECPGVVVRITGSPSRFVSDDVMMT